MKIFQKLMEQNEVPMDKWMLYADVACQECKKEQSLAMYRSNNSKCVKCGSEIHV